MSKRNIHGIHLKFHFDEWRIMMVTDAFADDENYVTLIGTRQEFGSDRPKFIFDEWRWR